MPESDDRNPPSYETFEILPVSSSVALLLSACVLAQTSTVASPSGQLQIIFSVMADGPQKGELVYDVAYRGKPVLVHSRLGMDIQDQRPLGANVEIVSSTASSKVDETYSIPAGKSNPVRNLYNTITVELHEPGNYSRSFSIEARAYDDGVAFRYSIPDQDMLKVLHLVNERTQFQFSKEATTYPLILRNFQTSWEDSYHTIPTSSIHPEWLVALPLLAEVPGVAWVGITEADIENYAGHVPAEGRAQRPRAGRAAGSPRGCTRRLGDHASSDAFAVARDHDRPTSRAG